MKKNKIYIDSEKNILIRVNKNKCVDIKYIKNELDLIKLKMQESGIIRIDYSKQLVDFNSNEHILYPLFKEEGYVSIKKLRKNKS